LIVCLGWGSLIWDPRTLLIKGEWQNDGPVLPVEFVRQSQDGRLTLVIDSLSKPISVCWVQMDVRKLSEAVENLTVREGTSSKKIGRWPNEGDDDHSIKIGKWAESKKISAVVWTALGPKFSEKNDCRPSRDEALAYLSSLTGEQRRLAKLYIEKAPPQIDTDYRRAIKAALGW
jgi:hypothetical protein